MSEWEKIILSSGIAFVFGLLAERLRLSLGEHVKVRRYRKKLVHELNGIIITLQQLILDPTYNLPLILNHDFTHYKLLVAETELFYGSNGASHYYKLVFSKAYDLLKNPSYSLIERQIRAGRLLLLIKYLSDQSWIRSFSWFAPFSTTIFFRREAIRRMEVNLEKSRTVLREVCGNDVLDDIALRQELMEPILDCPLHPF